MGCIFMLTANQIFSVSLADQHLSMISSDDLCARLALGFRSRVLSHSMVGGSQSENHLYYILGNGGFIASGCHEVVMVPSTPDDLAALLSERRQCFEKIISEPRSKCDLANDLSYSRSTLDRAISELKDAALISYDDGVWTPTLLGWCTYQTHTRYWSQLGDLSEAAPILQHLSMDDRLDCSIFEGATIHEVESAVPDAVIAKTCESLRTANSIKIATPTLMIGLIGGLVEGLANCPDTQIQISIPQPTYRRAKDTSESLLNRFVETCNVQLHHTEIPFSFGLWCADMDRIGIIGFSEQGITGMIVNDTDEAVRWANRKFDSLTAEAKTK